MIGQTLTRATGVLLGFEISVNPFSGRPSWEAIAHLPLEKKLETLRQPAFRARLFAEECSDAFVAKRVCRWDRLYPLGTPPDYEPPAERSVAAIAARRGAHARGRRLRLPCWSATGRRCSTGRSATIPKARSTR